MRTDPFLGPYDLDAGWVPSLRYLTRRARILDLADGLAPASLLEVGCGAGTLLAELSARGFACTGLESSPHALSLARALASGTAGDYEVVDHPGPEWRERFAYVAAFDVLEHIENDDAALRQWHGWLQPGGALLLSVPAHSHRWGPGDEWAGHFRRYDAEGLKALLHACDFEVEHFECYGFPLANLTEWLGRRGYARLLARRQGVAERDQATALSGVDRKPYLRLFGYMRWPPVKLMLAVSFWMQKRFRHTDWGSGYLVVARRR